MSTQMPGAAGPGHSHENDSTDDHPRTVIDWITVAGDQLVATVKQLVADGNVRRVILRDSAGKELLSVPLTASAVVGGITVLAAPVLAAIGVVAAMVAEVTLEVERTDVAGDSDDVTSPSPNYEPEA